MVYYGADLTSSTRRGLDVIYGKLDARSQYAWDTFLRGLPGIGSVYQTKDNLAYMDDYLRNRGLDYSSIKYPSRTAGFQSLGSTLNYVSSNVNKLYDDRYASCAWHSRFRAW